jgi:F0F1-type ATP synthase membrane subunit b/b'
MTVTISPVYIIALWLYALVVTGFWVCALIGSGKERQDAIMEDEIKREALLYFGEKNRELTEDNEKLREEIASLKSEKRTLAEQYIKIQNEYAHYRILVRTANPKADESASVKMDNHKGAVERAGCSMGEVTNG